MVFIRELYLKPNAYAELQEKLHQQDSRLENCFSFVDLNKTLDVDLDLVRSELGALKDEYRGFTIPSSDVRAVRIVWKHFKDLEIKYAANVYVLNWLGIQFLDYLYWRYSHDDKKIGIERIVFTNSRATRHHFSKLWWIGKKTNGRRNLIRSFTQKQDFYESIRGRNFYHVDNVLDMILRVLQEKPTKLGLDNLYPNELDKSIIEIISEKEFRHFAKVLNGHLSNICYELMNKTRIKTIVKRVMSDSLNLFHKMRLCYQKVHDTPPTGKFDDMVLKLLCLPSDPEEWIRNLPE